MAVFQIEDLTGSVEAVLFPEPFQRYEKWLKTDAPLLIKGILDVEDSGARKIKTSEVQPLEGFRERAATYVTIRVNLAGLDQSGATKLQSVLNGFPGETRVIFELEHPKAYLIILRPHQFVKVRLDPQFVQAVESICGPGAVRF